MHQVVHLVALALRRVVVAAEEMAEFMAQRPSDTGQRLHATEPVTEADHTDVESLMDKASIAR